jgi:hypothetical protein
MSVLTNNGIYSMPADIYHADPCKAPSLSASIATVLCTQSPAHARHAHPRLNPDFKREVEDKFDLGSAAHDVLLEGAENVAVIDASDFRTKDAKAARDIARAANKIPILKHRWDSVLEMVNAIRSQLMRHQDGRELFSHGAAEQTLVWQEPDYGGIWCRARADYLRGNQISDLKTTSASAEPDAWTRTMFGMGSDIQAAFYLRGLKAITGHDGAFRFCVVEAYAPYALSVVALDPGALVMAQKKCLYALETWHRCLESNEWPGYPTRTCYAEMPPYLEAAWTAKELR